MVKMIRMKKLLANHNNSGISLLEIMIVIAMIAITAAIAVPNMLGWRGTASLKGAVSNLKGDLNFAKAMASRENAEVMILFEEDFYRVYLETSGVYGVQDADDRLLRHRKLPAGVTVDLALTSLDTDRTSFNPRGLPSNLGIMVLVDKDGNQRQIQMTNRLGRLVVQ